LGSYPDHKEELPLFFLIFKGLYKIGFTRILMGGTLIVLNSSSWFTAWVGLELNIMSFIPLIIERTNKERNRSEASLKYFLVQVVASILILIIIVTKKLRYPELETSWTNKFFNWKIISPENGIQLALAIKIGIAPLHFWFPRIIEKLTWNNLSILLTWQKLAPLRITINLSLDWIWSWLIICSVWVGSTGGLNQTTLRKLLAYSSINHIGWLACALKFRNFCWLTYFFIYRIITIRVIWVIQRENCYLLSHIWTNNSTKNFVKIGLLLSILSLGGLPPFLGFFPKWNVINLIIQSGEQILGLFIIIITLVTLYYYFRIAFVIFIQFRETHKITNTVFSKNWEITPEGGLLIGVNFGGLVLNAIWLGV